EKRIAWIVELLVQRLKGGFLYLQQNLGFKRFCAFNGYVHIFSILFDATGAKAAISIPILFFNGSISARRNSQRAVIVTKNGYLTN
ncbi:MAG: hypothetical protein IIY07_08505, partial [Thermoguttaceae bacterium]|nr:hypothetical protein [Thermoguttaceae bacterium]